MSSFDQLVRSAKERQGYEEFIQRYEEGPPEEGYSDEEVLDRYQQVATQLPPEEFQQSAAEAFARLSPEQREQFARWIQQQGQQAGMNLPDPRRPGADPDMLGQAVGQQSPNVLGDLLGSILGGGMAGGPGPAAPPRQEGRQMGGAGEGPDIGAMLNSPIAKAIMAGIVAMAAKRMMSGR
jgi:hypothetical protein